MTLATSRTARIRALAQHDVAEAQRVLSALLGDLFEMRPSNVRINFDKYSLNSLNGFFDSDGKAYFFKFHQEEREEAMTGEYYRAEILSRAGLPVDQPVHMSARPGEQILVYHRRTDPRFSDGCSRLMPKTIPRNGMRRFLPSAICRSGCSKFISRRCTR
jgi:hypothetical protein